jgi:hypothetical protein
VASPNPYTYLAEVFPDVEVRAADLGDDWGLTEWDANGNATIYLAYDLGAIQRRCVLAHEIHHVRKGAPCRSRCPFDEEDCRDETARWLLPDIRALGELMARYPITIAAERLKVIPDVINDRVDNFTEAELRVYRAAFSPQLSSGRSAAACNVYSSPRRTARDRRHPCRRVAV